MVDAIDQAVKAKQAALDAVKHQTNYVKHELERDYKHEIEINIKKSEGRILDAQADALGEALRKFREALMSDMEDSQHELKSSFNVKVQELSARVEEVYEGLHTTSMNQEKKIKDLEDLVKGVPDLLYITNSVHHLDIRNPRADFQKNDTEELHHCSTSTTASHHEQHYCRRCSTATRAGAS